MKTSILTTIISKTIFLFLIFSFSISSTIFAQYTLKSSDVTIENGVITSCITTVSDWGSEELIIPSILDDQNVVGIAARSPGKDGVFQGFELTSVKLPSSIEFVGFLAFYDNDIENLDLSLCSNIQHFEAQAFSGNQISSIDFSNCSSLYSFGEYAFAFNTIEHLDLNGCTSLYSIGANAFNGNQIGSLSINACNNLFVIGESAFSSSFIETLDLSGCSSLSSIGKQAFLSFDLSSVNMSNCAALTSIGKEAFFYTSLTNLTLPICVGFEDYGWKDEDGNLFVAGDEVTNLESNYYVPYTYVLQSEDVIVKEGNIENCSYNFRFKCIEIPNILDDQTVTGISIGGGDENTYGVFRGKSIAEITLPTTVEKIGYYAFLNNAISTLDFTKCKKLKVIGKDAFCYNSIKGNLDLSNCEFLDSIGVWAFGYSKIESISFHSRSKLRCINAGAFYDNRIASLDLRNCSYLTLLDDHAFARNRMSKLDLSNCESLRTIGASAFYFNNLEELNFEGCVSLDSIKYEAFTNNGIKTIEFDGSNVLGFIGSTAFSRNTLTEFELPNLENTGFIDWKDNNGNSFHSGAVVTDFETDYSANKTNETFQAIFTVLGFSEPIVGAKVSFNNEVFETDGEGQVVFESVSPYVYDLIIETVDFDYYSQKVNVAKQDLSETVLLTVNGVNKNNQANILVYPNPAYETVTLYNTQGMNVEIFNVTGVKMKEFVSGDLNQQVNLSNFSKGIYMVKIGDHIEKLIKK